MTNATPPAYGALALAAVALLVVAVLIASVKVRMLTTRWLGVRVYDFGADLKLPPVLRSRSYQIALYLTMKSLPRDESDPPAPLNAPAPSR